MIAINKKILDLCDERKWSTYELAQRADITHSTLNSCINRDNAPKIDTLQRICHAFGIALAQFFNEDEHMEFLNSEEKELICLFRTLTEKKKKALLDFIDF